MLRQTFLEWKLQHFVRRIRRTLIDEIIVFYICAIKYEHESVEQDFSRLFASLKEPERTRALDDRYDSE